MIAVRNVPAWLVLAALIGAAPALAGGGGATGKLAGKALVAAMQSGGYVIYFRHAATDHRKVDASRVEIGRCETQRSLSPRGRQQAERIGNAFKALRIPVGSVVTSPYCRARETGRPAFGEVVTSDDLSYTIRDGASDTERRAAALRRMLSTAPPAGRNTIIVGHTANLKEAVGIWPKPEGLAVVFRPLSGGRTEHVASVEPDRWAALARAE